MLRVGLTGGIGAGKSAVANRLARRGAVIIDSDRLAREVVAAGTDGLAEVVAAFGPEVLGADGELDRPALGARVFGDDAARRTLETIIHPRVRAGAAELTRAAAPDAIVVNDVPLLVETGQAPTYHLVVVVHADRQVRLRRLAATRGMSAEQAGARIAAQADDRVRLAAADAVLTNNAGLAELDGQIDRLWRTRIRPFASNLRAQRSAPAVGEPRIVPYDPAWPAQADRLIARVRQATGADVSHLGCTAVPGLAATDLIDLMLSVRTLEEADGLRDALLRAGFPRREGEWCDSARGIPEETWPKRLHGSADPGRPARLHVRVTGSPGWRFALLMRDHLRADPAARAEYAAHEHRWRAEHPVTGGDAAANGPWFDAAARAADAWAEATGWRPAT